MSIKNTLKEYETKDLYEASALYASGCKLIGLTKVNSEFFFVFEDIVTCSLLSASYWNYTLELPSKRLVDAIKSLKERLFSNRK